MKGFATSPNPYLTGMQPRKFLGERVAMLKREQMMKKLPSSYYKRLSMESNG